MKALPTLSLVSLLGVLPLSATEDQSHPVDEAVIVLPENSVEVNKAPEPNTALLAGLGGLALLLVAMRRK